MIDSDSIIISGLHVSLNPSGDSITILLEVPCVDGKCRWKQINVDAIEGNEPVVRPHHIRAGTTHDLFPRQEELSGQKEKGDQVGY